MDNYKNNRIKSELLLNIKPVLFTLLCFGAILLMSDNLFSKHNGKHEILHVKNHKHQQPKHYYEHVEKVSPKCITFSIDDLPIHNFPDEFRKKPTIQSGTEYFDVNRFNEKNRTPVPLQELSNEDSKQFHLSTNYLVQDMIIKLPSNNTIAVSESHKQFLPVIKTILSYEKQENINFDEYYAYLTIDQRVMEKNTSLRSPRWHIDGLHVMKDSNHRLSRVYTLVVTDSKTNITEYVEQAFPQLVNFDLNKYDFFQALEYLVKPENIRQAKSNTLYYMDGYTVHRSPKAKTDNVGKRTFLRVQLTPKLFNRKGNSVNPYFKDDVEFFEVNFPVLEDPKYLKENN